MDEVQNSVEEQEKESVKKQAEEPAEDISSALQMNDRLVEILDRATPKSPVDIAAQQLRDHEDNFRYHDDKIAVWEVSMPAIDKVDGSGGYHDIVTGSPESLANGLSVTVEMTKQGLIITDRFVVKLNRLPVEEWRCEYIIVDKQQWEDSQIPVVGAMLSDSVGFADLMARRGME